MLIGLISCSKAKLPHPAPARGLYSPSALFRGALRALEGRADVIYVLSAKHGLVPLDQVIEPYDQTLKEASSGERAAWASDVVTALRARHALAGVTVEFHAGMAYREPLESLLRGEGAVCTCPVEGLSQGRRLAYYTGTASDEAAAAVVQQAEPPRPAAVRGAAVAAVGLRAQIAGLRGETLQTGTGIPFVVAAVEEKGIVVVPERSGKSRPIRWVEVEGAYAALVERGQLSLAEVREVASEASPAYVVGLLARVPGVELQRERPMRLRWRG